MKYKIVSDSSSNLFNNKSSIPYSTVPLHVIVGEQDFADVEGESAQMMQEALDNYKGKTSTSCPNAQEWLNAFGEDADILFCITITSVLSGSNASANVAKQMYEQQYPERRVYVIDSFSTGPEMVLIIEKLEELIKKDLPHEAIYDEICKYQKHTHLFFSLASLDNFARNGRINPLLAKGIGILNLRIVGSAVEGNLHPMNKARGDNKALKQLVEYMKSYGYKAGKVIISHTANLTAAKELQEMIKHQFGIFNGYIQENRILCSYYAEPMSVLVGFETE